MDSIFELSFIYTLASAILAFSSRKILNEPSILWMFVIGAVFFLLNWIIFKFDLMLALFSGLATSIGYFIFRTYIFRFKIMYDFANYVDAASKELIPEDGIVFIPTQNGYWYAAFGNKSLYENIKRKTNGDEFQNSQDGIWIMSFTAGDVCYQDRLEWYFKMFGIKLMLS